MYACQNTGPKGPNHKPRLREAEVTIEHTDAVVDHWNDDGRTTTQEVRNAWYGDPGHLAVFCESRNKSKQAGGPQTYNRRVTIEFRGPGGK